tara:strand:+ start:2944 stop:3111 length:168 start_codon:yes stop_codon:yes gene_type:complete
MIEQIILVSVVGILVIYGSYTLNDSNAQKYNKNNTLMNEMPKFVDQKEELSREIL